eukprot:366461-Chlamydomonas_euryale.AAC.11
MKSALRGRRTKLSMISNTRQSPGARSKLVHHAPTAKLTQCWPPWHSWPVSGHHRGKALRGHHEQTSIAMPPRQFKLCDAFKAMQSLRCRPGITRA